MFCSKWASNRRERRLFQINIHFVAFTSYPLFASKKPSRESIFCGQVNDWWTEKALRMLKPLLNTRQKRLPHTHAYGQRHGKRMRLRMPRRAVKGHALKMNTTLTYKFKNPPTYKFKSNSPTQKNHEPISSSP